MYSGKMYRIAFRYVAQSAEAEDVVVVAFNKILSHIHQYKSRGDGSFEGWMRRIVVNECLMLLRSSHNFNLNRSLDEASVVPDLTQASSLEAEDLYKMIRQLPLGYRTVFNLYVIEGYAHSEIAQQLGIQEGTSRSQLAKAKEQLKVMLNKEDLNYGT